MRTRKNRGGICTLRKRSGLGGGLVGICWREVRAPPDWWKRWVGLHRGGVVRADVSAVPMRAL